MRVPLLVAVLAISGASCVAATAVPLLEAPELSSVLAPEPATREPVLVLEPVAAAASPVTTKAAALLTSSVAALPAVTVEWERIDAAPRFELLPDGALVVSYASNEAGAPLTRDVLLRDSVASAPVPEMPSPLPRATPLSSHEDQTGPYAPEIDRALRFGGAPAPLATQGTRVFDPRPTSGHSPATYFVVGGGLALAAVAGIGLLLYHRIRPNAALENETRKVIFDSVCMTPGLGVHEISRIAGVSYSTATYHLERLVGAGMIVMTPDGNKLCYYKNGGAFSESERKILPLLKNEEAAKLFEAILAAPGTYRAALAEQLGVTATTINWHLRRLREAGLVDETRAGRSAHLYARVDMLRPTFLALATKVEAAEPMTAEKLRMYAGSAGSPGPAAGSAA